MKRTEPMSVGDVMRRAIEDAGLQEGIEEARACGAFARVVGPEIAGRCGKPRMSRGVMTIGVPGSGLRGELSMHRSGIARGINEIIGKEIVKEVRLTGR